MEVIGLDQLAEVERAAKDAGAYAFDCETTGLDVRADRLLCLSFAVGDRSWVMPFFGNDGAVVLAEARERLSSGLFDDPDLQVLIHNAKFDLAVLHAHGFRVRNIPVDTELAEWITNEWGASPVNAKNPSFGLKPLVEKYFKKKRTTYEQAASFFHFAPEQFLAYAAEDAADVWRLWKEVEEPALRREGPKIQKIFHKMEMTIVPVIMEMESAGLHIDIAGMDKLLRETEASLVEKQAEIWKIAGHRFKIESSMQLSDILFGKTSRGGLEIPPGDIPTHKNSTEDRPVYSTDQSYLKRLVSAHAIIPIIQEYKKASTLKTNFLHPMLAMAMATAEHRIYPEFRQTGTRIGRLSSARPNSQNMPRKGGIRDCVVAPPGKILVCGDLSQIELRVLAHQSRDPDLIKLFKEGADIHKRVMEMTGLTDRNPAKTVSFGILYGLTEKSLAEMLKVSIEKAQYYYTKWYEMAKCVKPYRKKVHIDLVRNGFVESVWGRRRRFKGIALDDYADRQAFHMTISGTAADAIKIGMINLWRELSARREVDPQWREVKILAQVHDELLLEAPESLGGEAEALLKKSLENVGRSHLLVDIKAEVGKGMTWSKAKS